MLIINADVWDPSFFLFLVGFCGLLQQHALNTGTVVILEIQFICYFINHHFLTGERNLSSGKKKKKREAKITKKSNKYFAYFCLY